VDAPTIVYVPRHHYPNGFDIVATSGEFYWESHRQLLQWRPDPMKPDNLIIICPPDAFDKNVMKDSKRVQKLIPLARHRKTISPFVQ
jgi:hypothetical protein